MLESRPIELQELLSHVGHDIECVTYGAPGDIWNVAIQCETCGSIIVDMDVPPDVDVLDAVV